ncbi:MULTISPECIES: hypothetical protein [unclassified Duganella]|uniref:hypothetical protein n=1 Tax=unclassified Duganella TaxID=2636909 RepID=UPI0008898D2E|nr:MULTISPECIES: hypothetical protein [unclassified Duganella]SDH05279.1 Site-specific recombinase XerD [Duganella sp. OV458]SDK20891.1 Site-specific recombinase XerD [Duganella sp. OV510]
MPKNQTSKPSRREFLAGAERIQKYVGKRKVSFYYQHVDKTTETLATAPAGDRKAIAEAERIARRKALDIQQGQVVAGSMAAIIERFQDEIDPTHYRDQSKDGKAVRTSAYRNLTAFFGKMAPASLKTLHGYQFLDARAKSGAPAKANKEMSQMSTICHYAVRWGILESNPFTDMMQNKTEKDVRAISRSQVVRFYLWARRQESAGTQVMGCAAMFTYLTGYRAAEVRPFHTSGLLKEGVRVESAKRKKGEAEVIKIREWSAKLRTVVARAKDAHQVTRLYLFANSSGKPYTRSGWGSQWTDAQYEWIASFDKEVAAHLAAKKDWEERYRAARKSGQEVEPFAGYRVTEHPSYFSLMDVRPAAITAKLDKRSADAYDFAAHANPATTHHHYDRRKVKKATATE